jgi:hypothetical protein
MTELGALQQTLAAEHAALYTLGVLGGRAATLTDEPLRTALSTAYDVHLVRRDHLVAVIVEAGATPVAAAPAYVVPRRLTTSGQVAEEALRVERACAAVYAALVAASGIGTTRTWAIDVLGSTALAQLGFGGRPEALPGLRVARQPVGR